MAELDKGVRKHGGKDPEMNPGPDFPTGFPHYFLVFLVCPIKPTYCALFLGYLIDGACLALA